MTTDVEAAATTHVVAPTAADLLRGVTYLGHTEAEGVTLRVMHHGQTAEVHGSSLRVAGTFSPGCRILILNVARELRVVVTQ